MAEGTSQAREEGEGEKREEEPQGEEGRGEGREHAPVPVEGSVSVHLVL